jgi:hypothetical protein
MQAIRTASVTEVRLAAQPVFGELFDKFGES